MFKKMIYLAAILLVFGGLESTVVSIDIKDDGPFEMGRNELPSYSRIYTDTAAVLPSSDEESNGGSKGNEYDELEAEMKRLMDEMRRLGKEGKERFMKDVLPRIRREMEKFRKKLREFHREDEDSIPIGI